MMVWVRVWLMLVSSFNLSIFAHSGLRHLLTLAV